MNRWQSVEGTLAASQGFAAAATAAGFKKSGALDLALIFSNVPGTTAAGMFTTNLAAAAPVTLCRDHLKRSQGRARAILVNSGNANACTGRAGRRAAEIAAGAVAKKLGVPRQEVLVCSTGVIGVPLRTELILERLPQLADQLSAENGGQVARAIMTTDTRPKSCVLRSEYRGQTVHLAGVAKGAGMIHPRMATMLAFLTTDARLAPAALRKMLGAAVYESFNRITVDGDTSTNDTVLILASGASGAAVEARGSSGRWFQAGLTELCETLAKMIVQDGEGASKLATIEVLGARSDRDADRIARAIANSPLAKTAIAGSDPNWGRILCAAGYSGAKFDPDLADIRVNDLLLCRRGLDAKFDEAAAKRELDKKELTIRVELHQGKGAARIWTCDFTRDYIDINASYRT
jgi:glutamate N-acetyltransferase / amino-acid N-acetyltransferase